jgi:hypothetical protein
MMESEQQLKMEDVPSAGPEFTKMRRSWQVTGVVMKTEPRCQPQAAPSALAPTDGLVGLRESPNCSSPTFLGSSTPQIHTMRFLTSSCYYRMWGATTIWCMKLKTVRF